MQDETIAWADDILERLSSFSTTQQLAQKAEAGWRAWFTNSDEPIDGWQVEDLTGKFRTQMLCFKSGLLSYPYITTTLSLHSPNGSDIGTYRLITLLSGEICDDYIEIDISRSEYGQRTCPSGC